MKKIVIVMVTLMMVMASFTASAELRYETSRVTLEKVGVKHDGFVVWDDRYYVNVVSEHGDVQEIEVTKEEYNSILQEQNSKNKTSKPWYAKVASVASFWNPND